MIKSHVSDGIGKYHKDISISGVCRERGNTELNNPDRCNKHKNNIKQETIHPSLILLHGMKPTTKGNPNPKLHISFLYTPQQI